LIFCGAQGRNRTTDTVIFSHAPRRTAKQESPEPSLGMSVGVLCLILFGLFAFVANISVPDIQLAPTLAVDLRPGAKRNAMKAVSKPRRYWCTSRANTPHCLQPVPVAHPSLFSPSTGGIWYRQNFGAPRWRR
jgi:hypothetical protein